MSESMGYMDDKLQITLVEPLSAGKVKKKPGAKLEHGAKSKRGKDADSSADETSPGKHKAAKKAKKKAADDEADEPTDKAKPATKEAPGRKVSPVLSPFAPRRAALLSRSERRTIRHLLIY